MIFRVLLIVVLAVTGGAAFAQLQTIRTGNILVIDQTALITLSDLGRDILALEQSEQSILQEAGKILAAELEAEEAELTALRETLPFDEFRVLADAFNDKVEATRASQNAIDTAQKSKIEERRRAFFQLIVPQLGEIIKKYGSAAIIDRRSVLLFDKNLDITQETIDLLNSAYAENPDMIDLGN